MQKPGVIRHMTLYGFIYGTLLRMLYLWLVFMFSDSAGANPATILLSILYGGVIGGIPGASLGFIAGWIMRFMLRHIPLPITRTDFTSYRNRMVAVAGGITFLGILLLMIFIYGTPYLNLFYLLLLVIIPALGTGSAAAYAAHRYMLNLRAWANSFGKSKHSPKNKLTAADNFSMDAFYDTDTDRQSQIKQDGQ